MVNTSFQQAFCFAVGSQRGLFQGENDDVDGQIEETLRRKTGKYCTHKSSRLLSAAVKKLA